LKKKKIENASIHEPQRQFLRSGTSSEPISSIKQLSEFLIQQTLISLTLSCKIEG